MISLTHQGLLVLSCCHNRIFVIIHTFHSLWRHNVSSHTSKLPEHEQRFEAQAFSAHLVLLAILGLQEIVFFVWTIGDSLLAEWKPGSLDSSSPRFYLKTFFRSAYKICWPKIKRELYLICCFTLFIARYSHYNFWKFGDKKTFWRADPNTLSVFAFTHESPGVFILYKLSYSSHCPK